MQELRRIFEQRDGFAGQEFECLSKISEKNLLIRGRTNEVQVILIDDCHTSICGSDSHGTTGVEEISCLLSDGRVFREVGRKDVAGS